MIFNNPTLEEYVDSEGKYWFRLATPLTFTVKIGTDRPETPDVNGRIMCIVPDGFLTDFASVPWFLAWIVPPYGRGWTKPAILHDFLYSETGNCSRFLADSLFREAMYSEGVPFWRRALMYYAVRICGRTSWRKRSGFVQHPKPPGT